MLTLPEIFARPAQPYVFVRFTVRMSEMQRPAAEGFPQVFGYVGKHGLKPIGPAFYNYRRINMAETLDVEAGVAVERVGPEEGAVKTGILPGGRFVRMRWHGHPDKLEPVTGMLVAWSRNSGNPFDAEERADGEHFACRLELYESDPAEVPDMNDWWTELNFKLRG
jgi:effector-binding domain-containing protein